MDISEDVVVDSVRQHDELLADPEISIIETSKLQERFKFFEEFKEECKETRRFELKSETAKKMLGKFKQMESQSSMEIVENGPKPLKRITPPRELPVIANGNGVANNIEKDRSPERDPNIGKFASSLTIVNVWKFVSCSMTLLKSHHLSYDVVIRIVLFHYNYSARHV